MTSHPDELRYTDTHEWVRPDVQPMTLGITRATASVAVPVA